jgi:hypothetical protein
MEVSIVFDELSRIWSVVMNRRNALTTIGLSSLAGTLLAGCGQESESQKTQSVVSDEMVPEKPADDGLVELLFVQEAGGVRFADGKLTLTDLNPQTLYFADRPDDIAGFLSYQQYVELVYNGPDNFEEEPPNATLMTVDGDKMIETVLELSAKPVMEGEDMVFSSVKLILGEPPADGVRAVLFIDTVGRPMSPGSVAGVHRRHRRRRVRRVVK